MSAYASGWFPMAVEGGEIRWFSPDPRGIIPLDTFHDLAPAGSHLALGPLRDRHRPRLRGGDDGLRRDRARPRRSRHLDHRGDRRQLRRAPSPGPARIRSRPGGTGSWSAASTASRSAGRSSASRCSTARPTPRRSRWSRWSSDCARVASRCSTRSGSTAAPRAVRRDRDPAPRDTCAGWSGRCG